jgi:hypothetical protein
MGASRLPRWVEKASATTPFRSMTAAEQTLIVRGRADQVRALRRSFQGVMEPEFRAVAEAATSRSVAAFMSQVHLDPDIAVEAFFLEPRAGARPTASGDVTPGR